MSDVVELSLSRNHRDTRYDRAVQRRLSIAPACAIGLLALGLLATSCESGQGAWDDPSAEEVFQTFLRHNYQGEKAEAWALIAPADRERLKLSRGELEGKVPEGALPELREMLILSRTDNPYAIKRIDSSPKLSQAPKVNQRIELDVEYISGERSAATMIWTGEGWFVDLPLGPRKNAAVRRGVDHRRAMAARQ